MAVRHDARLRARHHVDRAQVHRLVRSPRRRRRARRILDAASTRRRGPHPAMSAWGLAWRTVARNPARAALAVSGVAVIGALLFSLLLRLRGPPGTSSGLSATAGLLAVLVSPPG